jgi:hypothetical protein
LSRYCLVLLGLPRRVLPRGGAGLGRQVLPRGGGGLLLLVVDAVREAPGRLAMGNIHPCADEAWPPIRHGGGILASSKERGFRGGSRSAVASSGVEEGCHSMLGRHGEAAAAVSGEATIAEARESWGRGPVSRGSQPWDVLAAGVAWLRRCGRR